MRQITVAVMGDSKGSTIHLTESITRCLGLSMRYDVSLVEPRAYELPISTELVHSQFEGDARRLSCLRELRRLNAHSGVELLIPAATKELGFFLSLQQDLIQEGIQICIPETVQLALQDPRHLAYIAWLVGFEVAQTQQNESEALHIAGIGDGLGGCCGLAMAKQVEKGVGNWIISGNLVKDSQLSAAAKTFAKVSRWRGPFELQCIKFNGKLHLLKLNANFPSWVHLTATEGASLLDHFLLQVLDPYPRQSRSLKYPKDVYPAQHGLSYRA